jgi:MoaD family protein
MKVTIKFFPYLQKVVGTDTLEQDVPPDTTLNDLLQRLVSEFPQLVRVIPNVSIALNRQIVSLEKTLTEGDQVALFPPVSGGQARRA